ncbi:MAG: hypothetical protein J1G38_06255 [Clostridiales bacterium]|nr:hypothetical protein [Clostridiales bacterium]
MEEKTKKLCGFIFAGVVLVGLVLAIVGMFIGEVTMTAGASVGGQSINTSTTVNLFEEGWGEMGAPSNVFAVISFIVLVVGLAAALVDAILRLFVKKNIKLLTLCAAIVSLVGAVLVLVSGIVLAGQFPDVNVPGMTVSYSIGIGGILAFIGGLLGGVCALLPAVGPFKE